MTMIMEITRLAAGRTSKDDEYVRLAGRSENGRSFTATAFSSVATALRGELERLIPEGVDVGSLRLLVELQGEFRDGKQLVRDGRPVTRTDGSPVLMRSLHVKSFRMLTGPVAELTRMRRDAAFRLDRAEDLRRAGDVEGAYKVAAEFLALVGNRPFDIENEREVEDELFGDPSIDAHAEAAAPQDEASSTTDPEAAAASVFAREDAATANLREGSVPTASADSAVAPNPPPSERDVLDDAPASSAVASPRGSARAGGTVSSRPSVGTIAGSRPVPVAAASQDAAPAGGSPTPRTMRRPIGGFRPSR